MVKPKTDLLCALASQHLTSLFSLEYEWREKDSTKPTTSPDTKN